VCILVGLCDYVFVHEFIDQTGRAFETDATRRSPVSFLGNQRIRAGVRVQDGRMRDACSPRHVLDELRRAGLLEVSEDDEEIVQELSQRLTSLPNSTSDSRSSPI